MSFPRPRRATPPALLSVLLAVLMAALLAPIAAVDSADAVELRAISGRVFLGSAQTPARTGDVIVEYLERDADPATTRAVEIGADGSYRIDGLPDGTSWFLHFRYLGTDGFADTWFKEEAAIRYPSQAVNLQGADWSGADQTLKRKGFVQGQVTLGAATTVAPAGSVDVSYRVYEGTSRWSAWSQGVSVDEAGRYLVPDLPPSTNLQLAYRYLGDGPFQSAYWPGSSHTPVHYEHQVSGIAVGSPWAPDGTIANVTLPSKVELVGSVMLGDAGVPAPADSVRVTLEYGTRTWSDATWTWQPVPGGSILVDAEGRYRFSSLDSARYRLTLEYVAGTAYAPRTVEELDTTTVRSRETILQEAYTLSGRVFLGSTDRPAGAGEVLVSAKPAFPYDAPAYGPVATSADGGYAITGLPGARYEVRLEYVGTEDFPDVVWAGAECVVLPCYTTVDSDRAGYDMVMKEGRGIEGAVADSSGRALEGIAVTLRHYRSYENRWVDAAETTTPADGRYRFDSVGDGDWSVRFSDPAGTYATNSWPGIGDYYEPWVIDLRDGRDPGPIDATMLRAATIEGRVTGIGFSPAHEDLEVEVVVYDDHSASWVGTGDVHPVDASGRYRIAGLQPDWYRVVAWYDGSSTSGHAITGLLTLDEGETVVADVAVRRAGVSAARDFSGDGNPDVLVRTGTGLLRMYAGNGAGGWQGASTVGSGWTVMNNVFSAGDFSGDGYADVMARDGGGRLVLYLGNGRGGWLGSYVVGTGWGGMTSIFSPGDFSGDGNVDVMARDGAGNLWLYTGDGRGGWGPVSKVGTGWNVFDQVFAAGGFGGAGGANVMGRTPSGDLWVYPASGAGGWAAPARVGTGWNVFDVVLGAGDFDGDGNDDVMGRDRSGRLWLYPGAGGLGWKAPAVIGTGWGGLSFVM